MNMQMPKIIDLAAATPQKTAIPVGANLSARVRTSGTAAGTGVSSAQVESGSAPKGEFGLLLKVMMANASRGGQLLSASDLTLEGAGQTSETTDVSDALAGLFAALTSTENSQNVTDVIEKLKQEDPKLAALLSQLCQVLAPQTEETVIQTTADTASAVNALPTETPVLVQGENSSAFWQKFEGMDLKDKTDLINKAVAFIAQYKGAQTSARESQTDPLRNIDPVLKDALVKIKSSMADETSQNTDLTQQSKISKNVEDKSMWMSDLSSRTPGLGKMEVPYQTINRGLSSAQKALSGVTNLFAQGEGDQLISKLNLSKVTDDISMFNFQQAGASSGTAASSPVSQLQFHLPVHDPAQIQQLAKDLYASISKGNTEINIAMKPDYLGNMRVKVILDGDNNLSMTMKVDSVQVKQMVESSLPTLKEALVQQGVRVTGVDVNVNDSTLSQDGKSGEPHHHGSARYAKAFSSSGYEKKSSLNTQIFKEQIGVQTGGIGSVNFLA